MSVQTERAILYGVLVCAAVLIVSVLIGLATPSKASSDAKERTRVATRDIEIVDGDTIRVGRTSYRLMGFDTPETFQAKCSEELRAGHDAATRLSELVMVHEFVELDVRGKDKYRRSLAVLYAGGVDVSIVLIREGHAVPYNGRTKRRDWCTDVWR